MKRIAAYLASAALGAVLVGSGPAWAQMRSSIASRYPYNPDNYAYNYVTLGVMGTHTIMPTVTLPVTPTATDTPMPIAMAMPIRSRL